MNSGILLAGIALAELTVPTALPEKTQRQLNDSIAVCREMDALVPQLEARGGGQYARMQLEVMRWALGGMLQEEWPLGYTNRVIREAWQLAAFARPALERAKAIRDGRLRDTPVPRYRTGGRLEAQGPLLVGDRTWPDGRVERNVPLIFNGWGHFGRVRTDMPMLNRMGYNYAQIEEGIYKFMPHKGIVNTNAIEEVRKVATTACGCDSVITFLLSPHYIPGWIHKLLPKDNGKCDNGFMHICIHDPNVNQVFADYCQLATGLAKDIQGVHSFTLTNEPHGGDDSTCRAMRRYWNAYLAETYGTVADLNAKWKTSYASFEDVEMQKFPDLAKTPAALAFIRCNRKATGDFHAALLAGAKKGAPGKPCHSKIVSNECLYGPKFQTFWTIDARRFSQMMDYLDNDPISFANFSKDSRYAARWQESESAYDLLRTYAAKPLVNTENHNIVDQNLTAVSPVHTYSALWQNAVHGQVATAFWSWERGLTAKSSKIGLAPEQPDALEAMGRCSLDLQRLSKELAPIMAERPTILVMHSLATIVLGKGGAFTAGYSAASFLGESVGVLTDEALVDFAKDGKRIAPFDTARVIVLPSVTHLPRPAIAALRKLEREGMKVLAFGDELAFDDCLTPLTAASPWTSRGAADEETIHGVLAKETASTFARRPRAFVPGTSTPVFGAETHGYALKNGIRRIALCNQLKTPVTVDVGAKGRDLITGQATGRTFELPSRVPMFVELERE